MPVKNHRALDRRDQSSKRLIPHTYTKGSKGRREQHERTLSKPEVANMAKWRVTEKQAAMKSATRCGNIDGRVDRTKSLNRGAVPEL
ncbi:hypothetical protein F2Q69_00027901 [Brassica cretica]|uniref:Uncharacterized protein n=1 Tax=Brassica cretica TaxID=69181 RepID=A0A8S9S209_BRACR|nr:hypothetical protein F2Q69_00027901 [Brassica cretica]